MDYKELFDVSAPGNAHDFAAKVAAKLNTQGAISAGRHSRRTMYTLTATLVVFAIAAGGVGLWLNSNSEPNERSVAASGEPSDDPPATSKSKMLCPRTGKIIEITEVYANPQPGMFNEISDFADSFNLQMGRLEMTGYIIPLENGVIKEVSSQNGQVMWFADGYKATQSIGNPMRALQGWELKKGDTLMLSFTIELPDALPDGQIAEIGYFDGKNFVDLYTGKIKGTFDIEFVAPKDGEYFFYHINASSLPQNFLEISITSDLTTDPPTPQPALYNEISDFAEEFKFSMFGEERTGYRIPLENGVIREVSSRFAQTMWFTGWELKKGDKLTLMFQLIVTPEYAMNGQPGAIGYFDGKDFVTLLDGNVKSGKNIIEFVAPKDGEYSFLHFNGHYYGVKNFREISITSDTATAPTQEEPQRPPCEECAALIATFNGVLPNEDFVVNNDNVLTLTRIALLSPCEHHSDWTRLRFYFTVKEMKVNDMRLFPVGFFGVEYDGEVFMNNSGTRVSVGSIDADIMASLTLSSMIDNFDTTLLTAFIVGDKRYEVDIG